MAPQSTKIPKPTAKARRGRPRSRPPGSGLGRLTDKELLDYKGSTRVLTPEQRKRRLMLQRKKNQANPLVKKARALAAEDRARLDSRPKTFRSKVTAGKRKAELFGVCCREGCAKPRMPDSDVCVAHGPRLNHAKLKAPGVMREVIEVAVADVIKPYFSSLGLEFVGFDVETNTPVVRRMKGRAGLGICLHGESKDGDIRMTDIPNLTAQVAVADKLLDRVYGRPRTTTVIEGGVSPIKVQPVKNIERAQQVADLLARSHAIPGQGGPHEGRQRREPPVADGETVAPTDTGDDDSN